MMQIKAATGSIQYNVLKRLEDKGRTVTKEGKIYRVNLKYP